MWHVLPIFHYNDTNVDVFMFCWYRRYYVCRVISLDQTLAATYAWLDCYLPYDISRRVKALSLRLICRHIDPSFFCFVCSIIIINVCAQWTNYVIHRDLLLIISTTGDLLLQIQLRDWVPAAGCFRSFNWLFWV